MLKIQFKNWTVFEKVWLSTFIIIIMFATIYFSVTDTDYASTMSILLNWVISPVGALSGIICVVLAAKGFKATWYWGIVNTIFYGYLAFMGGIYGDFMINIFFFLPTQFVGIYSWNKLTRKKQSKDVPMRQLTIGKFVVIALFAIFAIFLFGQFLYGVDNWFTENLRHNEAFYGMLAETFNLNSNQFGAYIDASTEVFQILAQIFMIMALKEQWFLWILTNIISIFMWTVIIIADPSSVSWAVPVLAMWIAFLINSFYGLYNWTKGAKSSEI